MKTRKGVALLTLAAGLAALPATGAGAVDVATYSVTAFERTSTITLNGTNDGGGQFSGRSRTTYKFSGRRGKNKISIDFRKGETNGSASRASTREPARGGSRPGSTRT